MIQGFFVGLLSSLACVGAGALVLKALKLALPAALKFGLGGAVGVGILGTLVFLFGVLGVPQFGAVGLAVVFLLAAFSIRGAGSFLQAIRTKSPLELICVFGIGALLIIRLGGVLSPSDANDWDSISHQMAMSKIWLLHGRVDWIPFMDHSNIPAAVNCAYVPMLQFGDQYAAKTLIWMCALFAICAVGGFASMRYGADAGWIAAVCAAVIPVFVWEAGSAYIDIPHGIYSGFAILFACSWLADRSRRHLASSALLLGLAFSTKYTGFQAALGIGIAMVMFGAFQKRLLTHAKAAAAMIAAALVICSPWLIRNVVNTGNPVYPFFYSVFGGRNWNSSAEAAYKAEQSRFGIGQTENGRQIAAIPGSVTALSLQPGKQINNGTPWGAVGPLFVFGLVVWCFSKKKTPFESGVMLSCTITLLSWFFLTQQSRYILGLTFPVAVLLGGAAEKIATSRMLIRFSAAIQGVWCLVLFGSSVSPLGDQLRVILGGESVSGFLRQRLPDYFACEYLNDLGKQRKVNVALFDEVRGFYFDVPYIWANPGHHTLIPYEKLASGDDLIAALKSLGITHVYVSCGLDVLSPQLSEDMMQGLRGDPTALSKLAPSEPWRRFVVQAAVSGRLRLIKTQGRGFLFELD